jgi:hypothetical protein
VSADENETGGRDEGNESARKGDMNEVVVAAAVESDDGWVSRVEPGLSE